MTATTTFFDVPVDDFGSCCLLMLLLLRFSVIRGPSQGESLLAAAERRPSIGFFPTRLSKTSALDACDDCFIMSFFAAEVGGSVSHSISTDGVFVQVGGVLGGDYFCCCFAMAQRQPVHIHRL